MPFGFPSADLLTAAFCSFVAYMAGYTAWWHLHGKRNRRSVYQNPRAGSVSLDADKRAAWRQGQSRGH